MIEREPSSPRDEPFMRAAAWIGDLGNPFYEEERNRDVWNEASAVGFQIVLALSMAAVAAAVWIVGAEAVPYATALYAIVGVASVVTVAYAERLGVDVTASTRMARLRMLPYIALVVVGLVGILLEGRRTLPDIGAESFWTGLTDGTILGALVGGGAVVAAFALAARRGRSRRRSDPDPR